MKTEKQILKRIEKAEALIVDLEDMKAESVKTFLRATYQAEIQALLWVIGGKPGEGEVQQPAAVEPLPPQLAWERLTDNNYPEDNEECLWCTVPIVEPPYSGCRADENFPGDEYFTHFFKYKNEHWPDEK